MTFLHLHDQGLPIHALGERRVDHATATRVRDALRAQGHSAAAQAMAHQQVDLAVALRVLVASGKRRADAAMPQREAAAVEQDAGQDFAFIAA